MFTVLASLCLTPSPPPSSCPPSPPLPLTPFHPVLSSSALYPFHPSLPRALCPAPAPPLRHLYAHPPGPPPPPPQLPLALCPPPLSLHSAPLTASRRTPMIVKSPKINFGASLGNPWADCSRPRPYSSRGSRLRPEPRPRGVQPAPRSRASPAQGRRAREAGGPYLITASSPAPLSARVSAAAEAAEVHWPGRCCASTEGPPRPVHALPRYRPSTSPKVVHRAGPGRAPRRGPEEAPEAPEPRAAAGGAFPLRPLNSRRRPGPRAAAEEPLAIRALAPGRLQAGAGPSTDRGRRRFPLSFNAGAVRVARAACAGKPAFNPPRPDRPPAQGPRGKAWSPPARGTRPGARTSSSSGAEGVDGRTRSPRRLHSPAQVAVAEEGGGEGRGRGARQGEGATEREAGGRGEESVARVESRAQPQRVGAPGLACYAPGPVGEEDPDDDHDPRRPAPAPPRLGALGRLPVRDDADHHLEQVLDAFVVSRLVFPDVEEPALTRDPARLRRPDPGSGLVAHPLTPARAGSRPRRPFILTETLCAKFFSVVKTGDLSS